MCCVYSSKVAIGPITWDIAYYLVFYFVIVIVNLYSASSGEAPQRHLFIH